MNPVSVATAAESLGMSPSRVRELCLEHSIGFFIPGIKGRLLTPADVKAIEANRGKVGNPAFVAKPKAAKKPRKRPTK